MTIQEEDYDLEKINAIAMVKADNGTGRFVFQHLSTAMRGDKDVALTATKHRHTSLMYATPKLRNNKEFMLEAVQIHGANFRYATPKLRDDRELALTAIKKFSFAIEDCSDRLKDDIHLVREAVAVSPYCYRHSSERIQKMLGENLISESRQSFMAQEVAGKEMVKILDAQILHDKLNKACSPKFEANKPKMKI